MPFYRGPKIRKCKYCDEAPRKNIIDGRNKGYLRTCGSEKCLTEQHRDKIVAGKKGRKGSAHPKYIKDRNEVKKKRLMCEHIEWKKKVFERDDYTCQNCGNRGGKLNADHILPYSLFEELRESLTNGRTLCEGCHKKTSTYGNKLQGILRQEFLIF